MHIILGALSLGAAAIHLAAGPAHVEALGDIGLGFYWAAMFQAAIAIGFLRAGSAGPGSNLRRVAMAGSFAITASWVVSRTIGLPLVEGGPEPIGTADLIAAILQLVTIALLVAGPDAQRRAAAVAPRAPRILATRPGRGPAAGVLVAVLAVIALSSSIAVADAAAGHGHAPGTADDHGVAPALVDDHAALPADHGHAADTP